MVTYTLLNLNMSSHVKGRKVVILVSSNPPHVQKEQKLVHYVLLNTTGSSAAPLSELDLF